MKIPYSPLFHPLMEGVISRKKNSKIKHICDNSHQKREYRISNLLVFLL